MKLHDYQAKTTRRPRPKGTTNSAKGAGLAWLHRIRDEAPDGRCRDWPFGQLKGGYGQVTFEGRITSAHRAMLILMTGTNPVDLLALHSCDRPICCAPWHLRWGTQQENTTDAFSRARRSNAHNFEKRMCSECGLVSNPGAIGKHRKSSGHQGVMPYVQ